MSIPRQARDRVRLDEDSRSDIWWWHLFLERWNGVSFFPAQGYWAASVTSDASGSWGCGAFLSSSAEWFQVEWPPNWSSVNIATKELVAAAAIWGRFWSGKRVMFLSDNQAVVQALSTGSARDPSLLRLLRCLFFFEACFRFEHSASHVAGNDNIAADALSRNNLTSFFASLPQAPRSPLVVPPPLIQLLLDRRLSWTSPRWRHLFTAILEEVLPHPHMPRMTQLRIAT